MSTMASPTVLDLLRAIPDSLVSARSPVVASVEEVGPTKRPEEPVEEQTVPPPVAEASSNIVRVGPDSSAWGVKP